MLRNFYDNAGLVLFDHRVLAVGTLTAYTVINLKAHKANVWKNLPGETKLAMNATMAAVAGQVGSLYLVFSKFIVGSTFCVHAGSGRRDDAGQQHANDAGARPPGWCRTHPRLVDLGDAHAPLRASRRHPWGRQVGYQDALSQSPMCE